VDACKNRISDLAHKAHVVETVLNQAHMMAPEIHVETFKCGCGANHIWVKASDNWDTRIAIITTSEMSEYERCQNQLDAIQALMLLTNREIALWWELAEEGRVRMAESNLRMLKRHEAECMKMRKASIGIGKVK
jgi:hypothetical protein